MPMLTENITETQSEIMTNVKPNFYVFDTSSESWVEDRVAIDTGIKQDLCNDGYYKIQKILANTVEEMIRLNHKVKDKFGEDNFTDVFVPDKSIIDICEEIIIDVNKEILDVAPNENQDESFKVSDDNFFFFYVPNDDIWNECEKDEDFVKMYDLTSKFMMYSEILKTLRIKK